MEIPVDQNLWQQYRLKISIMLALLLLGLAVASSASSLSKSSQHNGPGSLTTVKMGQLQNQVSAFGQLVPQKVQSLIAMVDGRVKSLQQRPGNVLKAGEIVLELVNPKLQRQLEEQELAVQAQQSELLLLTQQLAQEALQLKHEQQLAIAEQKLLSSQLNAKQELFKQQIISALDFAQSQALLAQAEQKVLLAKERLQLFAQSKQSRQSAANLALQRIEKQRDIAAQDVQALQIVSEIPGQLIALDEQLKPGSRVDAGQAVGQLAEPGLLLAELKISAVDATAIQPQQQVEVNVKGKKVRGQISWISPNVVDSFIRVDVELNEALPDTARANIEVTAEIRGLEYAAGLLSSRPGYINSPNRSYPVFVYDVAAKTYRKRQLQIGEITQKEMQIIGGVAAGEQLLLQVPAALMQQEQIEEDDIHG